MLVYDKIAVDTSSYTVTYDGNIVKLHPKEYFLLQLFLQFPNQVLSYDAIIDKIWKFDKVPTHSSIRSHIRGLRKALNQAHAKESVIETVHGIGYRLKPLNQKKILSNWQNEYINIKEDLPKSSSEYLIVNERLMIQYRSPGMFKYCDYPIALEIGQKVMDAFPELIGLEKVFSKILQGDAEQFELKGIKTENNFQRNLSISICKNYRQYRIGDISKKQLLIFWIEH